MSKKLIDCSAKILVVVMMVFLSFSFRSLAIKFFISISIAKTVTYVFSTSFGSFLGISSKSVTQLEAWQACLI